MKYFLVTTDIGNPLYFDHPNGRMLCLPLATTQDVMQENFGERFTTMRSGNSVFVFQQYGNLCFLVVSDQGETDPYLRRQLHILYELFPFLFGDAIYKAFKDSRQSNFLKNKARFRTLVDTLSGLCETEQSFLVQSVEILDVNEDIRVKAVRSMNSAVDGIPSVTHTMLFVGTKLTGRFTRSKQGDIHPSDMFLLILRMRSLFHPLERDHDDKSAQVNEPPVADYKQHGEAQQPPVSPAPPSSDGRHSGLQSRDSTEDEGFESANDKWANDSSDVYGTPKIREHRTAQDSGTGTSPATSDRLDTAEEGPIPPLKPESQTESSNTDGGPSSSTRAPDHGRRVIVELLYLRIGRSSKRTACRVCFMELGNRATLIVVTKESEKNPITTEKLDIVKDSLYRSFLDDYLSFLEVRDETHITMVSFLHQFPGMVHFICVDRTRNVVVAPTIIPLHGKQSMLDATTGQGKYSKMMVKSKVWDMCYHAQERLTNGFTSMLVKAGDFQYSYKLWFEDADGNELATDQPLPQLPYMYDCNYYPAATKTLFPSARGIVCFELYTLYLGVLSSQAVAAQNRRLALDLKSRLSSLVPQR